MTAKQKLLIDELIRLLPEAQKPIFKEMACFFAELGYFPQKQKVSDFVLAFKHGTNGKVIAKAGIRKQAGFISIKFFACKSVPEKYAYALKSELEARNGQYGKPLPINSQSQLKNWCGHCGSICSGGGLGYYYRYPNGTEIVRCGAYPIVVPDIGEDDIDDMKKVVLEQHNYFLSIIA